MRSHTQMLYLWDKGRYQFIAILFSLMLTMFACASDSSSDSGDKDKSSSVKEEASSGDLSIAMKADYGSGSGSSNVLLKLMPNLKRQENSASTQTCETADSTDDGPNLIAGSDCDGDGGKVAYSTPSSFKIAIKKMGLYNDSSTYFPVIAEADTLAESTVIDLSQEVTLNPGTTIPQGVYPRFEIQIYYVEMVMEINNIGETQNIRIYLSDDNFPGEGNLGHHQGDLTIINGSGNEVGWVDPGCQAWNSTNTAADRSGIVGAGGTDSETDHKRGLYGNSDLWDTFIFKQGRYQDIFTVPAYLGLQAGHAKVTLTFDVEDTWYYEDYDANNLFNPGGIGTYGGNSTPLEACHGVATWSPLISLPTVTLLSE